MRQKRVRTGNIKFRNFYWASNAEEKEENHVKVNRVMLFVFFKGSTRWIIIQWLAYLVNYEVKLGKWMKQIMWPLWFRVDCVPQMNQTDPEYEENKKRSKKKVINLLSIMSWLMTLSFSFPSSISSRSSSTSLSPWS